VTAICSGGVASQPKAGVAPFVAITTAGLGALAKNWPMLWAVPYIMALTGVNFVPATFCATDPPADPGFNATDAQAILDLGPSAAFETARAKLVQLMQRRAWFDLCECVSGPPPAVLPAPAAPVNLPGVNPNGFVPNGVPCRDDIGTVFGVNPSPFSWAQGLRSWVGLGVTSIQFVFSSVVVSAPGITVENRISWSRDNGDGTLTQLSTQSVYVNPGATVTVLLPLPATANALQIVMYGGAGTGQVNAQTIMHIYCGGAVPGGVGGCCTDPTTNLLIDQVLQTVRLIQRQAVPFAYISSTVHAGLVSSGSFAIQGLIGVRIQLTTVPGTVKQDASTPPYLFNVGWASMSDGNGFIDETRIHSTSQVWMSRIASDATVFGYSLNPGIVATVTELVREP
jgi:hypothetical protein